jgi:PAS domain S-box-containing protein
MRDVGAHAAARLESLVDFVARMRAGEVGPQHPISEAVDEIDAVAAALNFLAEDFQHERRRRAEAEERLGDAVDAYEHAPALFCSVDAGSARVVECNQTFARRLGREREALLGRPLRDLYHHTARPLADESLAALRAGEPPAPVDHALAGPDGAPIPTLFSGAVVRDAQGSPARLRLVFPDVGDERRLEAQLASAQKMEERGRLAGGVAHDFNNLLTAMLGSAEMLRDAVQGEEARQDLEALVHAVRRVPPAVGRADAPHGRPRAPRGAPPRRARGARPLRVRSPRRRTARPARRARRALPGQAVRPERAPRAGA